jgi:hypothetical protein|tara:strand:- start:1761 stop:2459 length:699 start_codon:yes stop_codon:yes gene_type:complete
MALPVLASPEFMTEIPSTKQKIKFRPFLVREEKILYMALEGEDSKEIENAIVTILSNCIIDTVDIDKLTLFDIEYLFLQLRGKSVGEKVELMLSHSDETNECTHKTKLEIDLDTIKIQGDISDGKLMLDDTIGVKVRYPYINDSSSVVGVENDAFSALSIFIEYVYDKENVYNDFTKEEIAEWLEQLNQTQFGKLIKFFQDVPKLSHTVEWTCPECKQKDSIKLEGLQSFFT